jgi:hypothetical protein
MHKVETFVPSFTAVQFYRLTYSISQLSQCFAGSEMSYSTRLNCNKILLHRFLLPSLINKFQTSFPREIKKLENRSDTDVIIVSTLWTAYWHFFGGKGMVYLYIWWK